MTIYIVVSIINVHHPILRLKCHNLESSETQRESTTRSLYTQENQETSFSKRSRLCSSSGRHIDVSSL